MTSNMQRTRTGRLEESNIASATRTTGLRRVPGSGACKIYGVQEQMLSQVTASCVPPTILMDYCYPHLKSPTAALFSTTQKPIAESQERRNPGNRNFTVINGIIHHPYGQETREYRTTATPQVQAPISRRNPNLLTKAPLSQYSKRQHSSGAAGDHSGESGMPLSGMTIPQLSTGGVVEKLRENSKDGQQRKEVLIFPPTETTIAAHGSTPPGSQAPSMIKGHHSQGPGSARPSPHIPLAGPVIPPRRPHSKPSTRPVIPPRRPHTKASANSVRADCSAESIYKSLYHQEHELASKLQRNITPTTVELAAERQRLAELEEEAIVQRAQATQNQVFTNHYHWLYERAQQQAENAKKTSPFEAEANNEVASPVSPEIPTRYETSAELDGEEASPMIPETPRLELSAELPCTPRNVQRGSSVVHALSTTTSQPVLRHSHGRARIEDRARTLAQLEGFPHERSASASRQIIRPTLIIQTQARLNAQPGSAIQELPGLASHEARGAELEELLADEPTFAESQCQTRQRFREVDEHEVSYFSDDSDDESEFDSNPEIYELPESPQLPTLLSELAESSHFSASESDSDDELYKLPESSDLFTSSLFTSSCSEAPTLPELYFTSPQSEYEAGPRAAEGVYRFGGQRVEATPAVFRVPFSRAEIDYEDSEVEIAGLSMKMGAWEWCSVPDLGLRDPRE